MIVNFETWLGVTPSDPITATAAIPGLSATVTATGNRHRMDDRLASRRRHHHDHLPAVGLDRVRRRWLHVDTRLPIGRQGHWHNRPALPRHRHHRLAGDVAGIERRHRIARRSAHDDARRDGRARDPDHRRLRAPAGPTPRRSWCDSPAKCAPNRDRRTVTVATSPTGLTWSRAASSRRRPRLR